MADPSVPPPDEPSGMEAKLLLGAAERDLPAGRAQRRHGQRLRHRGLGGDRQALGILGAVLLLAAGGRWWWLRYLPSGPAQTGDETRNESRMIEVVTPSVSEGERIRVKLLRSQPQDATTVSVVAFMVTPRHTSWAFSAGAQLEQQDKEENLSFAAPSGIAIGLYMLTRLEFRSVEGVTALETTDADQRLFELRLSESKAHSAQELRAEYKRILENRQEEVHRGLGSGPQTFTAVVFVKNCLVTTPINLGPFSILPRRGISANDELEAVQEYVVERGGQALALDEEWERTARIGQRCAVVPFPVLRAQSRDEAFDTALRETDLLLALLSLHRGGLWFNILRADPRPHLRRGPPLVST